MHHKNLLRIDNVITENCVTLGVILEDYTLLALENLITYCLRKEKHHIY